MQVREGPLDDPASVSKAGAVLGGAPGYHGLDAARPQLAPVLVVVIAAVREHAIWALARAPALATHRADAINKRKQLSDVVALAAGQRYRQRDTGAIDQQVMLGAATSTINRRGPGQPPFSSART